MTQLGPELRQELHGARAEISRARTELDCAVARRLALRAALLSHAARARARARGRGRGLKPARPLWPLRPVPPRLHPEPLLQGDDIQPRGGLAPAVPPPLELLVHVVERDREARPVVVGGARAAHRVREPRREEEHLAALRHVPHLPRVRSRGVRRMGGEQQGSIRRTACRTLAGWQAG